MEFLHQRGVVFNISIGVWKGEKRKVAGEFCGLKL